jgi:hypothetical protein
MTKNTTTTADRRADVVEGERLQVEVEIDRLGGRPRPAPGDHVDRVERLERVDRSDHGRDRDERRHQRQRDEAEEAATPTRRRDAPDSYGSIGSAASPPSTISITSGVQCQTSTSTRLGITSVGE